MVPGVRSRIPFLLPVLKPQQEVTITSLIGYVRNEKQLEMLLSKTKDKKFLKNKALITI